MFFYFLVQANSPKFSPMTIVEISTQFPTELHAIQHFEKIRWGKKPKCAYCTSANLGARNKDHRYACKDCSKTSSVTTGTNLHNTRLPLKTWLFAFAVITDAKKGVSAKQLERNLGVSYETAYTMYMKVRGLMAKSQVNTELDGIVEMDETFVGGKPRKFADGTTNPKQKKVTIPKLDKQIKELKTEGFDFKRGKGNPAKSDANPLRGRGSGKMTPVVGLVERDGDVIAQVMKSLTYDNLSAMVKKYVDEDDSVLVTDEYSGYNKMNQIIEHIKIDHQRLYSYKGVNTNSIESFWAIIKRGIIGQYHQVSVKHLHKYIAEFVFKYNNRKEDNMFEYLVKTSMTPINR